MLAGCVRPGGGFLKDILSGLLKFAYLIFVIVFTRAKFLENKIYTEKKRKLRQNTQKLPIFCVITAKRTVNCQFFALNL